MNFVISPHAHKELKNRQISLDLLNSVLENPQQIVPEYNGKKAYQSKFNIDNGKGKVYLIRAIVKDYLSPPVVVTVYKTSKINKYWRDDENRV